MDAVSGELLRAEGLQKRFVMDEREVRALDGVDLTLDRGEIMAVVGMSGAGKSTLLQILGALDTPTEGKVYYEGRDVFAMREAELAAFRRARVGFVFQSNNLLNEFSAEENVALAAMIAGAPRSESLARARELLARVGLSQRLTHRPGKLSGGEQQRVAIARALVNSPALALADEPTGDLDSKTGEEIMELIFTLNRDRGQTFVIVTHNMALAARMSRIIRIQDGKIVAPGGDVLE
ncbi:MAG: ABC transporter ATP-binding protein [Nitrospinae bacterium]|nr:ABC transporter ATP-binding protein [Nitrospinota bacterium]